MLGVRYARRGAVPISILVLVLLALLAWFTDCLAEPSRTIDRTMLAQVIETSDVQNFLSNCPRRFHHTARSEREMPAPLRFLQTPVLSDRHLPSPL